MRPRQSLAALRAGARAEAFQADVADEAAVARMFQEVMNTFGRLDVLVTAAAVWDRRAAGGHDRRRRAAGVRHQRPGHPALLPSRPGGSWSRQPEGGAIVTIGDWACARPYAGYAAYFLSKGAIPTLTRALAVELAQRNRAVRVNCILPGPVMLPENLSDAEVKGAVAGTLLKRPGRPENVAQAVLFLVENDYVTGVCLAGGRRPDDRDLEQSSRGDAESQRKGEIEGAVKAGSSSPIIVLCNLSLPVRLLSSASLRLCASLVCTASGGLSAEMSGAAGILSPRAREVCRSDIPLRTGLLFSDAGVCLGGRDVRVEESLVSAPGAFSSSDNWGAA